MTVGQQAAALKAKALVEKTGISKEKACEKVGISTSTYYRWNGSLTAKTTAKTLKKQSPAEDKVTSLASKLLNENKQTKAENTEDMPKSSLQDDAKRMKSRGKKYQEIAQTLRISMGEVFKHITGKNIVEEVDKLAVEKGLKKRLICENVLKIPFSAYTGHRYGYGKRYYEKRKTQEQTMLGKGRRKKKASFIDIEVPSVEQVKEERRASKKDNKVVVFVCDVENLSNVLKGIQ